MAKPVTKTVPGRPAFKSSAKQRRAVEIAAGAGMSHESIALALGVSRATLNRYFKHEMTAGACKRRMEMTCALYAAAIRGNVSGVKAYLALGATPAAPREVPLGKKAAANLAARTAHVGSDWESLLGELVDPDKPLQ